MTDSGFAKAGRTMASAQREPNITEHSGSSWQIASPGGGHRGSPEDESLLFILYKTYKRGVKVKDTF